MLSRPLKRPAAAIHVLLCFRRPRRSSIDALFAVLVLQGALWIGAPPPVRAQSAASQPNILFILTDDHAWPAYGFMKAIEDSGAYAQPTQHAKLPPIETPNLDRLAARGVVFPEGHSGAPKCGPSMRSVLTGKQPGDYLTRFGPVAGERILPEYLADLGYESYGFGKIWGDGFAEQGFTEGGDKSISASQVTVGPLLEWLQGRVGDPTPWFVYYGPSLPHEPYKYSAAYQPLFLDPVYDHCRGYYANIAALDHFLGEILDTLVTSGLDSSTMVVLMTDNGYMLPNSKSRPNENAMRTPFLVSWPGHIPAGAVLPQLVHATDLAPTLFDYAGAAMDSDATLPDAYPDTLTGISMRQYFEGGASVPGRAFILGEQTKGGKMTSVPYLLTEDGRMRVLRSRSGHYFLFDLWENPDEDRRRDLSEDPLYAYDLDLWKAALDAWRPLK